MLAEVDVNFPILIGKHLILFRIPIEHEIIGSLCIIKFIIYKKIYLKKKTIAGIKIIFMFG